MQANWSLILNVLLLISVLVAIKRLMKTRKQSLTNSRYQPAQATTEKKIQEPQNFNDDIIAVRKVEPSLILNNEVDEEDLHFFRNPAGKVSQPSLMAKNISDLEIKVEPKIDIKVQDSSSRNNVAQTLMFFLLAKENRQFAGYELLQTVLASGLRFGEGHIFHRHQYPNGQGPVLCSLAAATPTGVFDLQNIGAFSVRGLCLYMYTCDNPGIDAERFAVMLDTAKQLSEGLDAHLLDERRRPLTQESISRYHRMLRIQNEEVLSTG